MIDFDKIRKNSKLARTGFYHVVGAHYFVREAEFDALVEEVERLRDAECLADARVAEMHDVAMLRERAAVVAWLREVSERRFPRDEREAGIVFRLSHEVERGEHRKETP